MGEPGPGVGIEAGDTAELVGLRSRADLNGRRVEVQGRAAGKDGAPRFRCRLLSDGGGTSDFVKVKAANLKLLVGPPAASGRSDDYRYPKSGPSASEGPGSGPSSARERIRGSWPEWMQEGLANKSTDAAEEAEARAYLEFLDPRASVKRCVKGIPGRAQTKAREWIEEIDALQAALGVQDVAKALAYAPEDAKFLGRLSESQRRRLTSFLHDYSVSKAFQFPIFFNALLGCEFDEDGRDVEAFLRNCDICPWWERPAAPDTPQKDRDLLGELQQALRPINIVHGWNFWVPKIDCRPSSVTGHFPGLMLLFETGELAPTPPPAGVGSDKPEEYKSAIDEWRALQLMFQQMLQQFGEQAWKWNNNVKFRLTTDPVPEGGLMLTLAPTDDDDGSGNGEDAASRSSMQAGPAHAGTR